MNSRKPIIMSAAILLAMGILLWLGHEHRNEVIAFLRALRRTL